MGNEHFFYERDLSDVFVGDFDAANLVFEQLNYPFRLGPAFGEMNLPTPGGILPGRNCCALYVAKSSGNGEYSRLDKALEMHREFLALQKETPFVLNHLPSVEALEAVLGAKLDDKIKESYQNIARR